MDGASPQLDAGTGSPESVDTVDEARVDERMN